MNITTILILALTIFLSQHSIGMTVFIIYTLHFADGFLTNKVIEKTYKEIGKEAFEYEQNELVRNIYKKFGLEKGFIVSHLFTFILMTILIIVAIFNNFLLYVFYLWLGMQTIILNNHLANLEN